MSTRASFAVATARRLSLASIVSCTLVMGGCTASRFAAPESASTAEVVIAPPSSEPPRTSEAEPLVAYEGERFEHAFYAPASLALRDGCVDLLVHFHGAPQVAARALEEAKLGAALVNVNLGAGSSLYREAFAGDDSFDRLVDFAMRELSVSGRLREACLGRIALSAWSAGYAAAREILQRHADAARLDALVLVDGFFTDWKDRKRHAVDENGIAAVIDFGRRALNGERFLFLTHTAIDRKTYAGADVSARVLLRSLDVPEGPPPSVPSGAGGSCTYAAEAGDLHVLGFSGKKWRDHVGQHRAMGALHYAELARYWRRGHEP